MFESNFIPNPLAFDPGSKGGAPAGDGFVAVSVVADIIPVRIINSNPIQVLVTNFPGQPPPLPGLRGPTFVPPLPGGGGPKPKGDGFASFMGEAGLGNLLKLGTIAGAAAAGIGLIVGGVHELKATFIDPIVGAAKGGFDEGLRKGMGTEVLSKSFEVLGVTIGVRLLPPILRLSAAALTLADTFDQISESPLGKMATTSGMEALGKLVGNEGGGWLGTIETIRGGIGDIMERLSPLGQASNRSLAGLGLGPNSAGVKEKEKDALNEVIRSLSESLGAKPGFVGVADIRAQAQQAALEDPLEAKIRQLSIEALNKFINETAGDIADTAKNTGGPGGHHA